MKFLDYIKENSDKQIDIYFDMDGVFAEYDIGNFDYSSIRPIKSVIDTMKSLRDNGLNIYVLSICKNNRIVDQKYEWISKNVKFLDRDNLVFISKEENEGYESNELKSNYLLHNINKDNVNILVDDDSLIIKKVVKENKEVKVFHVSSIIE